MEIEARCIDYIPEKERHGEPKNLFDVWFSGNMHMTGLVTGALCVNFGLNLFWSVVAIIVGNCLGAVFMALHSAQGPRLGIPQMIQSRAQFGVYGAVIPIVIVILMYLGFYASSNLLGAEAISEALSTNPSWGIVIMSITVFLVTLLGYNAIHSMQRYLKWVFVIAFIIVTVIVIQLPIPTGSWSVSDLKLPVLLLSISVVATWQLSYAPYVADYSRYLPSNTSMSKAFWYSYLGTVLASFWMMVLGVFLTTSINGYLDHASSNLAHLFGPFSLIILIIIFLGQLSIDVFNLYGAFMSMVTTIEPFIKINITPKVRGILLFLIATIGTIIALFGQGNFLNFFTDFILFLSYFLIPWTAINLIDFYLIRQGHYKIEDFFNINGQYGKINWATSTVYIVSVFFEVPFINCSFYIGPISRAMNGTDIAWIIGLMVPVLFNYFSKVFKVNIIKKGVSD